LKREAIASLLAHSFFTTFDPNPGAESGWDLPPDVNFSPLYVHAAAPQEAAKLHCLMHYFDRIANRTMCFTSL